MNNEEMCNSKKLSAIIM